MTTIDRYNYLEHFQRREELAKVLTPNHSRLNKINVSMNKIVDKT